MIFATRPATPLVEGKTKKVYETEDPTTVIMVSKDDITAGDGRMHDVIEGKAELATQTTCNVFHLLRTCGIPVAYEQQVSPTAFAARKCEMLPYEVVIRREAHGSYLKRRPDLKKGHVFPRLILEFFLKTSGRKWKHHELVCDDPFMVHHPNKGSMIYLYDPKLPDFVQSPAEPFLQIPDRDVFVTANEDKYMVQMGEIARHTFLILEKAWQVQGSKLVDFKVEFGMGPNGELLLADVIDNDSWRVVDDSGAYIDKQAYRDGGALSTVTEKYRQVAELTGRFSIPSQQLVLWRGSESDDLSPFYEEINKMTPHTLKVSEITCSVHKQPGEAYRKLQQLVQEVPDTVIIAYIGRSNGAGPTLSANTTVPVITVPTGYKDFPLDIWSSLRAPSNVPVMTVLEPANATLAALQILAMRNPAIYGRLRYEQEKRLTDI